MYVNDFVVCINKLLVCSEKVKGEIINISSGQSVSLRTLIDMCSELIGSQSVINYGAVPYKAKEIMDLNCSVDKYESIIGKKIKVDMKTAVKECIEFYSKLT
jgi:nucleoside-diphosphate-sugar epimerase